MVQKPPRHCPRCNTPFAENQRICARCGFNLDASLSGLNAPQEPYPGQLATQFPQPQQASQHPLPPASQQISQHPLPSASRQVSQHPLPPPMQQMSQHSELMQPQISQHPEEMQSDEIPTQAQPAVNPTSSPQSGQQISQHPEEMQSDEIPTQAQPAVKPASSPQWGKQQPAQHPETMQADEIPTQAQPTVNPMPAPQSEQQHSLHPETMQPGRPPSGPQWGKQQFSMHPETMHPTGQPVSSPQSGPQQPSLHPETMQQAGRPPSGPQWGQQASLHPETMQPGRPPSGPQWGQQQPSLHPETMRPGGQAQPSLHPETAQPTAQPASSPQKRNRKPMLIALVLLALIVLGGVGGGYFFFAHRAPTQTPITTTTIHSTAISYAGVDVTILNVQRSSIFLDDPNIKADSFDQTTSAMVRVNLQAQNTLTTAVNMIYSKIARLVLPGGKVVTPIYVKAVPAISPGMTQPARIDFVVPATSKINQLVLRLGASNEAQLNIPLVADADMSMYGPKTEQMSGAVTYQGLNWSLVKATTQLSVDGLQASSGMQFVTVTLKVDNTLQQPAITGSPFDYLRLKADNITTSPLDSTLPLMFAKGETGKTGTVTFMAPQDAKTLTLLFQQTGGFDAQTLTFNL
jgi:predicted nucleic acid-binding Zn ribbon protein